MAEMPRIVLRVRPEHQSLVRNLAARLTADSGFAETVAALLEGPSSATGLTGGAETAALTVQVIALETAMIEVQQILRALLEELRGRGHDPLLQRPNFSAGQCSEAAVPRDLCP